MKKVQKRAKKEIQEQQMNMLQDYSGTSAKNELNLFCCSVIFLSRGEPPIDCSYVLPSASPPSPYDAPVSHYER